MWELPSSSPWISGLAAVVAAAAVALAILRSRRHLAMARRLRERDEDLAAVLEASPEVIGVMNTRSGRVEHLNGNAERLFGRPRSEVERLSPADLSPEFQPDGRSSRAASVAWVDLALHGEKPTFEWVFLNARGEPAPCEVRLVALPPPRQHLVRFSVTDITERKRAETEARRLADNLSRLVEERTTRLSESEASLRAAQRIGRIASWRLEFPGRHFTWSEEITALFEAPPEGFATTLQAYLDYVLPEDRDLLTREFEEALRRRTPFAVVHRAGIPQSGLRYLQMRGEIDYDPQGQPLRAIGTIQDISEVKLAELAERESLRLLRSVIEHAPIRVFWKDRDLRYLGCNSRFAHDAGCRGPEEVVGRTDFDLAWREQAELYRADDRAVMDSRRAKLDYEEPQSTPDGRTLWLRTSKVPLVDESGSMSGVLGIYEDISSRKELEAQLRQAQKLEAIGQLAGGVAHDFNNILASMMMNLGLLLLDHRLHAEARAALQELESEARRAARLTNQLLMFGRRSVLHIQPLEINDVVANLLKMLRRLIGETIELRFDPGHALPRVNADSGMIEQVLVSLVVNARDAMPQGGRITLATSHVVFQGDSALFHNGRRAGEFVRLGVSDTGCGMEPEVIKHVFEPFFTTKEVGKGSGLGLATVHGIAAQHQGWIEVESAPGIGTTFLLHLPVAPAPTPASSSSGPAVSSSLPCGTESILLVDDEPRVRTLAARTLRNLGYHVVEAAHGKEALELASPPHGLPALLMFNSVLPGPLNALDLARQLRALHPGLRLLVTPGLGSEGLRVDVAELPGLQLLPKPFSTEQLARAIRACLDHPLPDSCSISPR